MYILITGAYGFLGRNTAKEFKRSGHYVVGMGHGKWYNNEYLRWGIDEWHETTITFEALMNINKKFDLIIHCGGSGSVGFSHENPYEDFQKSVQSTIALFEYIRLHNKQCKIIYPSSPAVQGNLGNVCIQENMTGTPVSPYGFHKKIAEELCLSYHINFNINVLVIRFFSIYGNGLKKQLLWDACQKIANSDNVIFFGTGKETRDWIHISDATKLINLASQQMNGFDVLNAGSGVSIENEIIIKTLSQCFEKQTNISFNGQVKEGDPRYFWANIDKALRIGWKPNMDIEIGLKDYVNYFKNLDTKLN